MGARAAGGWPPRPPRAGMPLPAHCTILVRHGSAQPAPAPRWGMPKCKESRRWMDIQYLAASKNRARLHRSTSLGTGIMRAGAAQHAGGVESPDARGVASTGHFTPDLPRLQLRLPGGGCIIVKQIPHLGRSFKIFLQN